MAGGSFDFRQIEGLKRQIEQMERNRDAFCRDCAKELAARLLRKVRQRTPVDSGELRRNWTIGEIRKNGEHYEVEIINPTEYCSYVEYGHRTANHTGWVPGHFMLAISERELQTAAPAIIERKLRAWLKGAM